MNIKDIFLRYKECLINGFLIFLRDLSIYDNFVLLDFL